MVYPTRRPVYMKRGYDEDISGDSPSPKKARFPDRLRQVSGIDSEAGWETEIQNLEQSIGARSTARPADRARAEHLFRMIDAIAGHELLEHWKAYPKYTSKRYTQSIQTTAAAAIYVVLSRGQSRSFMDNVLLRTGKYLFASRIAQYAQELRAQGPPSKQPVSSAGSTGEGNAITRALKRFVMEIHPNASRDTEVSEIRKCKQWWSDGKIWMLLANAVDPAILLLIPSGHTSSDGYRIWDSE
ncbi:MAG: hypothetical protein Q9171_002910 [Xanthocarpia ochracea]